MMLQDDPSATLENYPPSIESKIAAMPSCCSLPELENVYREAKNLLFEYESALERCARYSELCPELSVTHHRQTFSKLLTNLHKTILETRGILANRRVTSARERLLNSRKPEEMGRDPADSMAQDISESLRSMSRTLQDELLRSEENYDVLVRSTKRLGTTTETYNAFGGVVTTSKRLIQNLWQRERTDRWMIFMALGLYTVVLLYIASRRLWFPTFIFPLIGRLFAGSWAIVAYFWRLIRRPEIVANVTTTTISESKEVVTTISSIIMESLSDEIAQSLDNATVDPALFGNVDEHPDL
jgi:hypothetical protein